VSKKLILATPRGFCAGVDRAIEIVERALVRFGAPIYVRHEIVHNRFVVDALRKQGAVFVDELDQVPDHAIVIFSAHGVPVSVQTEANERGLKVFDATCPLVKRVHRAVRKGVDAGKTIVLIGHAGHPEVVGTLGQVNEQAIEKGYLRLIESEDEVATLQVENSDTVSYVTQTTLSARDSQRIVEALKARFPTIERSYTDDICYATQNRQDAVRTLASEVELILVVGSKNSSNSNRLREIAASGGIPAYLIDHADEIDAQWLVGSHSVGVTAGASAPEYLVERVVEWFKDQDYQVETQKGIEENVAFSLPAELT
jgi:4-hydroxy-3-methylbut-2-enyl diphosphate reductase